MKTKRWKCRECGKEYVYLGWALRHNVDKHKSRAKFTKLWNWGFFK